MNIPVFYPWDHYRYSAPGAPYCWWTVTQVGWQCPVCQTVNAPSVTFCPHCKPVKQTEGAGT